MPERALTKLSETSHPLHPQSEASQQPETRRALAYDPLFDFQAYHQLNLLPQELKNSFKPQLDERTRTNLETNLGERFNVQVSHARFSIENGQFINSQHSEPFVDVVKRGVDYRKHHGNPVDNNREHAELLGFIRNQEILAYPNLNPNLKTVVISPRGKKGSDYRHNFFDIYQPHPSGEIIMTRYASKMNYAEFFAASRHLNPNIETSENLNDEFFLASPIVTDKPIDEILKHLHPDQETMNETQYQLLIKAVTPLIDAYLDTLSGGNYTTSDVNLICNTLLNVADEFVQKPDSREDFILNSSTIGFVPNLILTFGNKPVRQVMTGCGIQGGSSIIDIISSSSPFSVAEFGNVCLECQSSANHFHCPREKGGCGGKIPTGAGYTTCPHCQLTKEQAGSNC